MVLHLCILKHRETFSCDNMIRDKFTIRGAVIRLCPF